MTTCTFAHVTAKISHSQVGGTRQAQGQAQVPELDKEGTRLASALAPAVAVHRPGHMGLLPARAPALVLESGKAARVA
jgi:hypothetical protein